MPEENALAVLPRLRRLEEAQGRLGWLDPGEESGLLAACRASRNPHLYAITVVALEIGMRQVEVFGLTWERMDFSRGVTKSGRRREIPMRQGVHHCSRRFRAHLATEHLRAEMLKTASSAQDQLREALEPLTAPRSSSISARQA